MAGKRTMTNKLSDLPQDALAKAAAVVEEVETPAENAEGIDPMAALGLPSLLDDVLKETMANDTDPDENLGELAGSNRIDYAVFVQKEGKYLSKKYHIFTGTKDTDTQDEANYRKEIPILWIDALLSGSGRNAVGGRLMPPYKPDGSRDLSGGFACQSLDGVMPMPRYVGKELYDYRTGQSVKIGFRKNDQGVQEPIRGDICANCPMSQWMKLSSGKSVQLCKNNWAFVVWDVERNRMLKISGGNTGTQMALEGRSKDSNGAKKDGSPLPGIRALFLSNGERQITVPIKEGKVDLKPLQKQFVIGLSTTDDGLLFQPTTAAKEGFDAAVASGKFKTVVLKVPTYPYAPQGRPEHVGNFDVPVYPVVMTSVPNNFKLEGAPNPSAVPDFAVGTTPLTPDEYAQYLMGRNLYQTENMRTALLGTEMHSRVRELQAAEAPVTISAPAITGELPPGVVVGEEVTEGVFEAVGVAVDE
jgi:hypothetical protein